MTRSSNTGGTRPDPGADVVCLGESMVTFMPTRPGRLADVPSFERGIGGAESNVACALARTGHRTRWLSRVGADGFGDHLLETIAAHGVDVSHVQRDPVRPTGVYFRTVGERATGAEPGPDTTDAVSDDPAAAGTPGAPPAVPLAEVVYYRAGSAASALTPALLDERALWDARVVHVTGITAALSDGCLDVLRTITAPAPGRPLVSFDVNYRVGLWRARAMRRAEEQAAYSDDGPTNDPRTAPANAPRTSHPADGPELLLDLARGCDLVFVGEDEAAAAWGLHGPAAVRAALPEPGTLVVKQGSEGATVYARDEDGTDTVTFAPALTVDVVAPVGAGDAFAAGFLAATLRGLPVFERIRHGHLMAAASLTVTGDVGEPPSRAVADRLVALAPEAWGRLRLGPGWTTEDGDPHRDAAPGRDGNDGGARERTGDGGSQGPGTARVEVRTP
ncbi:sugar kinase [Streptomyces sp. NPDC003077]|uniref:sugar kinase n=1 Tax=Streptomyces sp. NPDC003077 TaxID=3154443 RepID=UPI0033BF84EA